MIQPKLLVLTMAATNQTIPQAAGLSATKRILATKVRVINRAGNNLVRVAFSTYAFATATEAFTAPGTLDATNSKVIPAAPAGVDNEFKHELSDGEIERGQYLDLSQWYINGTASEKVEVIYTPVGQIDR